jgi:hypothetical protein
VLVRLSGDTHNRVFSDEREALEWPEAAASAGSKAKSA